MREFKKIKVRMEETQTVFEGLGNGTFHNDCPSPYFNKEQTLQVLEKLREENCDMLVSFNEKENQFETQWSDVDEDMNEIYPEETIIFQEKELKLFGLGAGSWNWILETE